MDKALLVQIHLFGDLENVIQWFLGELEVWVLPEKLVVERNFEEQWCNVEICSSDPVDLWKKMVLQLQLNTAMMKKLSAQWIVICEGDDGWSDYKTLAHYDPKVGLDVQ